jgi:hypothetical protein
LKERLVSDEEEESTVEASLDEILAKRAEEKPGEEEEEESILDLASGDDRAEPLTVKALPQQQNEFVCKNCFLVKHKSQLADRKRMLCRDCA